MAQYLIVFWRDIPTQITVQAGRKKERRELPERFMQSVDACAMKIGAKDTDAYLAEWRRSDPIECDGDIAAVADKLAADFDKDYPMDRLKVLIENGGNEV